MKTMKYFLGLLLCMSIGLSFIACGNDDKDDEVPSIVGTWRFVDNTGYFQFTFNNDGSGYYIEGDVIGDYDNDDMELFNYTLYEGEIHFVWKGHNNLGRVEYELVDKNHLKIDWDGWVTLNKV